MKGSVHVCHGLLPNCIAVECSCLWFSQHGHPAVTTASDSWGSLLHVCLHRVIYTDLCSAVFQHVLQHLLSYGMPIELTGEAGSCQDSLGLLSGAYKYWWRCCI
jgi:hypothetical protein